MFLIKKGGPERSMLKKIYKVLGIALTVTVLASLLSVAAPASANVGQPSVSITPTSISTVSTYTIIFTTNKQLGSGDTITIQFDKSSTTSVAGANLTATTAFSASPGWYGITYGPAATAGAYIANGDAVNKKK